MHRTTFLSFSPLVPCSQHPIAIPALQEVSFEERSLEPDNSDEMEVEGESGFRAQYNPDDEERDAADAHIIATTMPPSRERKLQIVAEEDKDAVKPENCDGLVCH
jgi:hypothetical protein